ncbi:MAG: PP2C family protein-serine/threonine phosphatase [Streptosporangiaceae bacterium]
MTLTAAGQPGAAGDTHGMRVSARCLSLDPAFDLCGDWYLNLPQTDGSVLLAVGDAVGHGAAAAATMLRLRQAMIDSAQAGRSPGGILAELNTAILQRYPTTTASAVVACYRPDGELTWARAGHPPMLLADRRGVRPLANPAGLLLGVLPGETFEEATLRLLPGHLVIMYTDGMVERGTCIDEGIRELADRVGAGLRCPSRLLDQLDYRALRDDVCVLIAERTR